MIFLMRTGVSGSVLQHPDDLRLSSSGRSTASLSQYFTSISLLFLRKFSPHTPLCSVSQSASPYVWCKRQQRGGEGGEVGEL